MMDNINFRMLKKSEQKFIIKHGLFENIGKPIKLGGDIYYPILYRNLFLRYYITFNGCVYDIVTNQTKKYNLYDSIILIDINTNFKKMYTIRELIFASFYRFPEGSVITMTNEHTHDIEYAYHIESGTVGFYTILGVEFRKVIVPKHNRYYKAVTKSKKFVLIVSENGAVYDIQKKRFLNINIDDDGIPYIILKHTVRITIDELLLYSWNEHLEVDPELYQLINTSPIKLFVNRHTLVLFNDKSNIYLPLNNAVVSQNISPFISSENLPRSFKRNNRYYDKWLIDDLGNLSQIPIDGLSEYYISKCGIILNQNNAILNPYKIIYNNENISDVLYKFPNIDKIFSIGDILIWTYFRLNYSAIEKSFIQFTFHKRFNIPIVYNLHIISKFFQVGNTTPLIGEMLFTPISGFPNFFISTTGAIFNSKHRYFIQMHNQPRDDGTTHIQLPIGNELRWIDINKTMYRSWYGSIPHGARVSMKNMIRGDYSLANIQLNISSSTNCNINKVRKIHASINKSRDRERTPVSTAVLRLSRSLSQLT